MINFGLLFSGSLSSGKERGLAAPLFCLACHSLLSLLSSSQARQAAVLSRPKDPLSLSYLAPLFYRVLSNQRHTALSCISGST